MADEKTYNEIKAEMLAAGIPEEDIPEPTSEGPEDVAEVKDNG